MKALQHSDYIVINYDMFKFNENFVKSFPLFQPREPFPTKVAKMQQTPTSHYAILIGIDAYPVRPLKSCVQDVQDVQGYILRNLDVVNIQTFIAAESTREAAPMPESSQNTNMSPTYHNVTDALDKVATRANPGAAVYIHYSGHGTRELHSSYDEFSNESTGDLALVLLDGQGGTRCLYGSRLAISLKTMVERGLIVTLVLDCCFSASFYRRYLDPSIRFLPPDNVTHTAGSSTVVNALGLSRLSSPDGESRDASMFPSWLINPDGYVALITRLWATRGSYRFQSQRWGNAWSTVTSHA